jgi:exosortase family protein XrtF
LLKKGLKTYFQQYRPFFIFLAKFFLAYLVLSIGYQAYLSQYDADAYELDGFTRSVAAQTGTLLDQLGYNAELPPHESEPSVKVILENKYVARVVEGCNALSVMILFVAFVIAFQGKWKQTVLFVLGGCVLIHVLNIIRIALLSMALLRYPEYEHLLHGVIFPLCIYGVVFLLWVIWVNKFSLYAEQRT